ATSAVRQWIRRLGSSLKMLKNSTTPAANATVSSPKRHSQSSAKLEVLTSAALPASHAATSPLTTSRAPVPSTMARSSSLATGHGRRSSVSNTSLSAARNPPNSRVENHRNRGRPNAVSRPRWRTTLPSTRSSGGRALRIVFRLEQLAQLIHLLARQVAQATQLALQLAAGRLALRGEQEPYHGPDAQTEQERPERGAPPSPSPSSSLAHSPASRS